MLKMPLNPNHPSIHYSISSDRSISAEYVTLRVLFPVYHDETVRPMESTVSMTHQGHAS